ncbi:nuclear transport factor 2 family protein [Colwellia sp. D2M02]|uniref:nuclear transport factor 2 family protein n=1 Tax=Colwellia sp. D2M02 TaxID=2841562 RepID=UPI001C08D5C3|nr:nuclear transport factor 2 family protein [Colwellia sp. D2M02]MBU2893240.1 nuclear transport factor 2 family protein [Colwellia sp. D2M02]
MNNLPESTICTEKKNTAKPLWLTQFMAVYQQLSTDNLALLKTIYHQDIHFIDPMHEIQGLDDLCQYFKGLYENVFSCEFTINHVIVQENEAAIYWCMRYCHPKLNKGNVIMVDGHSHIKSTADKIIYHRDYLDLGEMLYEHLPLLGKVTQWIKARAAK